MMLGGNVLFVTLDIDFSFGIATSNKCVATSNKCLTSSNKKLLVTVCRADFFPFCFECSHVTGHQRS